MTVSGRLMLSSQFKVMLDGKGSSMLMEKLGDSGKGTAESSLHPCVCARNSISFCFLHFVVVRMESRAFCMLGLVLWH